MAKDKQKAPTTNEVEKNLRKPKDCYPKAGKTSGVRKEDDDTPNSLGLTLVPSFLLRI